MPLNTVHAKHLQSEVDQVRGLVKALAVIDEMATERLVSNDAHHAVMNAISRALDDLACLIEGYTSNPKLEAMVATLNRQTSRQTP